jgi:hypothetical protein
VIYAGKSTEDRRGPIPEQLRECREAAEADPLRRVVGEYTDEACCSAYRRDRGPDAAGLWFVGGCGPGLCGGDRAISQPPTVFVARQVQVVGC